MNFNEISNQAIQNLEINANISVNGQKEVDYDFRDNLELQKAYTLIKQNVHAIFLTGGAGTGKSTFIKYLQKNLVEELKKNCVVLAFTGIAAVNVSGQTIHSFFKFPIGPFENKEIKIQSKNPVIDHTDLIIIDEISMVSSWLLDRIDYTLRLWCNNEKPFGGKQLLFIGDCFQLPPIEKHTDPDIQKFLAQWDSIFFFAANVFKELEVEPIQLHKIYRQKDEDFIQMLNAIRTCEQGYEKSIQFLNEKCFLQTRLHTTRIPKNCLLLTTTNSAANEFNTIQLQTLLHNGAQSITFEASTSGVFDTSDFITPTKLTICIGATVMVTKNTMSGLVNGKMGKVISFGDSETALTDFVKIEAEGKEYIIQRETWQKYEYFWDEKTQTIRQNTVGTFTQIPLKLGWAVTIHKSQGLTLDNVTIDAENAWEAGQVYVALSRARGLNGILLKKKIPLTQVKVDPYVKEVYKQLFGKQEDTFNVEFDNIGLSNDHFILDTSANIPSVEIGGKSFELFPQLDEKIQPHVKKTMTHLLTYNLIPEKEMIRLLTDKEYCYQTFGIHFNFPSWTAKFTLLRETSPTDDLKTRYWKDKFGGYYICSQWYPSCRDKFAHWLIKLSKGNLGTINPIDKLKIKAVVPAAPAKAKEIPEWIQNSKSRESTIKKTLAEECITLTPEQEEHVYNKLITKQWLENLHKKGSILKEIKEAIVDEVMGMMVIQAKEIVEMLQVKRKSNMINGYCVFVTDTNTEILAFEQGSQNKELPWAGKEIILNVYEKANDGKITKWSWEYIT